MSLDVTLYRVVHPEQPTSDKSYALKEGHNLPGGEEELFDANITHNLGNMASEAGVYGVVWRPEESEISQAQQLIEPLTAGIALMKADPERFKKLNAPNGWGKYKHFLPWLERYLEACKAFPEARVEAER